MPDVPPDVPPNTESPAPVAGLPVGAHAIETPSVSSTPNLTDEELAKLAEQEAAGVDGEEVITVTGSLVERKELTTSAPISVVALAPSIILSNCYEYGLQSYCSQIKRDPVTTAISYIIDPIDNVGGLSTSGFDFAVGYKYKIKAGTIRHAVEGTYLFDYAVDTGQVTADGKTQILQGKGYYDLGVLPNLKFNLFTTWAHESGIGAGFNARFINGFVECDTDNCNDPENARRDVSKYMTADLFVDYTLKSKAGTSRISGGVNNVANTDPATVYSGSPNSDGGAYDFMGRYFYLRLSQLF